jgi:Flp pilus assembly protein TadD
VVGASEGFLASNHEGNGCPSLDLTEGCIIIGAQAQSPKRTEVQQRYTESEVARMLGVTHRQLNYWARLRLVRPRARWGERFYSFADLVALEAVKQLTTKRVPARRLHRAIAALQTQLGQTRAPLSELHIATYGREVVVTSPAPHSRPIEPLTGQFVLQFEIEALANKVRTMASRAAEEWFEIGLAYDSTRETLAKAAEAYERALELAPGWIEACINLGTVLYQLQEMEEAKSVLTKAAALEPDNPLVHYNLGCVLDQLGENDSAIRHLCRAVELSPHLADAHLNLAMAYEQRGQKEQARRHLSLYLHYEPRGAWAEFARSQIRSSRLARRSGKLTPFRKNG